MSLSRQSIVWTDGALCILLRFDLLKGVYSYWMAEWRLSTPFLRDFVLVGCVLYNVQLRGIIYVCHQQEPESRFPSRVNGDCVPEVQKYEWMLMQCVCRVRCIFPHILKHPISSRASIRPLRLKRLCAVTTQNLLLHLFICLVVRTANGWRTKMLDLFVKWGGLGILNYIRTS